MTPDQPWTDRAREEALDERIHGALQARATQSQPPGDGWLRLRSQVQAGPARRRRGAVFELQRLLNGMVQGAAAMIVIALLGATLTPPRAPEAVPASAAVEQPAEVAAEAPSHPPLEAPPDVPQRAPMRKPPAPPVYPSSKADMLNLAVLLKSRAVAPPPAFDPTLLPVFDPQLDPTLSMHL